MLKPKTCLLVDDDIDDHEIFIMALEKLAQKMNCITALNAPEALARLNSSSREEVPDYIFLDLNMPRMNGKQCLEAIKSQPHLVDIPVVIYSTGSFGDINEYIKMGAAAFIKKPSSITELTSTLQDFFSKS